MSGESKSVVLYAEDDPDDVFFMQRAFEKAGFAECLAVVRNGAEAIAYLAGHEVYFDRKQFPIPTFVLLDIKMPKVSGLEVLSWIRKTIGNDLPVFMLSSSSQDRDVQAALTLAANGYLLKPSNAGRLAGALTFIRECCLDKQKLQDRWVHFEGDQPVSTEKSSLPTDKTPSRS